MAFIALLVYLGFVLIRPQEFVPGLTGVPIVKYALLAVAALLVFQKGKRFEGPQSVMLFGFAISVFLSQVFAGWIGGAVEFTQDMLSVAILPFFVIATTVNSNSRMRAAMLLLVVAALVMVSNGITQVMSPLGVGWAGVPVQGGGRIAYLGILNDPNDLSMYLVMTCPLAAYLAKTTRGPAKWFLAASVVLIIYGVYLTNSRGGLLGLFAIVGFLFLLRYGMGKATLAGLSVIPVALFVLTKFREIDPGEASAHGRLDAWYQGVLMLLDRPIFGVGFGNFTDFHHLTAHNSFVVVFAEMGLVGYFFWLGFVMFCGIAVLSLWSDRVCAPIANDVNDTGRSIGRALTLSMIGYLVTGFFLSRAYSPVFYVFCGLMMAAFYSNVSVRISKEHFRFSNYAKYYFQIFFAVLFVIYLLVKLFV